MEGRGSARGRGIGVVAVGLLVAMAFAAGSASGAAKPLTVKKAKKLFYLESEAESRFLDATEGASLFFQDVVVVVASTLEVDSGVFTGATADCPDGTEAVGGGVTGHSGMRPVQSYPDIGLGDDPPDGTYQTASGWRGYFGAQQDDVTGEVWAVCAS
ncbi:MAG: hypothetical protein M3135_06865 [Actinomycetota bacterium]|nr:hypothetical protein [Actinomycetota bacterium]